MLSLHGTDSGVHKVLMREDESEITKMVFIKQEERSRREKKGREESYKTQDQRDEVVITAWCFSDRATSHLFYIYS